MGCQIVEGMPPIPWSASTATPADWKTGNIDTIRGGVVSRGGAIGDSGRVEL
jgi:hypothetical protein